MFKLRWLVWLFVIPALPHVAAAQEPKPIGRFVLDLRASRASYLASNGYGFDVGVHVYPVRWKTVTFGIGTGLVASRGSGLPSAEAAAAAALDPEAVADVETHFRALAPQISFNFGRRKGYSYISGGIAQSNYYTTAGGAPVANGPDVRIKTINYGAGARWFWNDHLAFCLDFRLYAINPTQAVGELEGTPRQTRLVISSGLSFH